MKAITYFLQGCGKNRFVGVVAIAFLVTGCWDDEPVEEAVSGTVGGSIDGGGTDGGGTGGGDSVTLTIGGSPPSQVLVGASFSFVPTVDNPEAVSLTFSASSLPGWASINSATGEVSGTPGAGDVGTFVGIRITVSGGGESAITQAYSVEVVVVANGSATLTWIPPTEKTDGSPLTDLAGYRILWGPSPSNLGNSVTINNAGITTYLVDELTPATWYFATIAFDADGIESNLSNVASKTII